MLRCVVLFLALSTVFSGKWLANDIVGVWINADQDAHIKIYGSYGKYYGMVTWLVTPVDSTTGKPQLDKLNKDPKLRSRPLLHMVVLQNLVFDADAQEWKDGTIYNPKSGTSYDIFGKMIDRNTLEMRFYVGNRALGKTSNWIRIIEK